ncbi:MAG: HEAT repeat domain-containing protein [Candidatus Helarchaeota archaeon]
MWVSECLQGKYKGLEKAARIYNVALEQPMYFRLVILELMENLTSGDQTMRRNSLWMLSKIVEERYDYSFMSPTIQILISSLQEKNQAIRYYSLKIITSIAQAYYDQFKQILPEIVQLLRNSSGKLRSLAAGIVTQFIEVDSNSMEFAINQLVKALRDKDLEIREVAIRALLRIDQHIDKVVETIMASFQDAQFRSEMIQHIFNFINRSPKQVIEALKKTIKHRDETIRVNSIVFMHQIAETKHVSDLSNAVAELLAALSDKNRTVRRTTTRILFLIARDDAKPLYRGIKKFQQYLKIKDPQVRTYFIYILVQLIKYFPTDLSEEIDRLISIAETQREGEELEPELIIINTISLCTLLRYNNAIAHCLNLAQDCLKKYAIVKFSNELAIFIGYTHYYLGNYSDSIKAFLKAETAYKREDYYTAAVASLMIAFNFALLRTFNSCLDYKTDTDKYFSLGQNRISLTKFRRLQFLVDFLNALCNGKFEEAQITLKTYHDLLGVQHPLDLKYQAIDIENLRKVQRFYLEQQTLQKTLNIDQDPEPPILK